MSRSELINISEACIFSLYTVTLVHDNLPVKHQNKDDIIIILNFMERNYLGCGFLHKVISEGGDLSALTFNPIKA